MTDPDDIYNMDDPGWDHPAIDPAWVDARLNQLRPDRYCTDDMTWADPIVNEVEAKIRAWEATATAEQRQAERERMATEVADARALDVIDAVEDVFDR